MPTTRRPPRERAPPLHPSRVRTNGLAGQNSCASGTMTDGQAIGVACCEACSQFNLSTTQSTSNQGNNQNGPCVDEKASGGEAWTDSTGSSCADYKENSWCSCCGGNYGLLLGANQACCTCGGGIGHHN